MAHEKSNQCAAWIKSALLVWYIEPALKHYCCYKLFVTETRSDIIANIVEFPRKM